MNKLSDIPAIREIQLKCLQMAKEKAQKKSFSKPKIQPTNYATIPLEDLKALEQTAAKWLINNKGDKNYEAADKRYKKIVHFLAIRTDLL